MSSGEQQIVCRRCQETIPADAGNCPHCGASIRGYGGPVAAIIFGLIVGVAGAVGGLWFYAGIGLIVLLVGAYLIYDKRGRIQEAQEQQTQSVSDLTEEE